MARRKKLQFQSRLRIGIALALVGFVGSAPFLVQAVPEKYQPLIQAMAAFFTPIAVFMKPPASLAAPDIEVPS